MARRPSPELRSLHEFRQRNGLWSSRGVWLTAANISYGSSGQIWSPAMRPEEYLEEVSGRGRMAGWCSQERVVGGFLTHCGWNSTLAALSEGVPMICWPSFAEQLTNCRYACRDWGVGMEIEGEVTREKVAEVVKVLMEGEKGKEMREKASEWKSKAHAAAEAGGSSRRNLDLLINQILLKN